LKSLVGGATRNKGSDFSADVGVPANIEPNHSSRLLQHVVLNLAMHQTCHPEFPMMLAGTPTLARKFSIQLFD
jgi:hypothetical protein